MRGGKREGAGRPKGSNGPSMRAILERAIKGGEMPIDYMLRIMRDEETSSMRRDEMAKAAARYLHAQVRVIDVEQEESEGETASATEPGETAPEPEMSDAIQ